MSTRSVFLAMLLVGCSAPATVVRPSAVAPTTASAGAEDTPKPCPPTPENHFGYLMNLDYARFVCLGDTLSTCYKDYAIWQSACGQAEANQIIKSGAQCQPSHGARSVLVVQGSYTEKEEAAAERYTQDLLVDTPIVVVCGTPLPKN